MQKKEVKIQPKPELFDLLFQKEIAPVQKSEADFSAKYGVLPKTNKPCKNCLKNEFCVYIGKKGHLPKMSGEHENIEQKGKCGLTKTEFLAKYGEYKDNEPCSTCFESELIG